MMGILARVERALERRSAQMVLFCARAREILHNESSRSKMISVRYGREKVRGIARSRKDSGNLSATVDGIAVGGNAY